MNPCSCATFSQNLGVTDAIPIEEDLLARHQTYLQAVRAIITRIEKLDHRSKRLRTEYHESEGGLRG